MARSFDEHISSEELNALVPSAVESGQGPHGLSPNAVREAERHVRSCNDCRTKVSKYRQLVNGFPNVADSKAAPPGADCPKAEDVDWHEVAAGLWPELKATQLILHAALCDHCGPLLRAATSDPEPTPQEKRLLAELKAPSRPDPIPLPVRVVPPRGQFKRWLIPAVALVIIGVFATISLLSPAPLSGPKFAKLQTLSTTDSASDVDVGPGHF